MQAAAAEMAAMIIQPRRESHLRLLAVHSDRRRAVGTAAVGLVLVGALSRNGRRGHVFGTPPAAPLGLCQQKHGVCLGALPAGAVSPPLDATVVLGIRPIVQ